MKTKKKGEIGEIFGKTRPEKRKKSKFRASARTRAKNQGGYRIMKHTVISQQNLDSHLDLLPLLKLIAKVNHQQKKLKMKKNPRTKNHVSSVNTVPF